jgi:XRE family transcriptional regulator, regulator of sulfur utilization
MVDLRKPDLVGRRIKRLREARGLSQHELARAAGITQSMLSQVESGVKSGRLLRLDAVLRLAFTLQVGVGELSGTWVDYQETEGNELPAEDALVSA